MKFPALGVWTRAGVMTFFWAMALFAAYIWRVSPELNEAVQKVINPKIANR